MHQDAIPFADGQTVEDLLDYPSLIKALRHAFLEPPITPDRLAISIPDESDRSIGTALFMPALRPGGLIGLKVITIHPGLSNRPGGATRAVYLVFDAKSGEMKGFIDGGALTLRRTAATSMLAALTLARHDAERLLIAGTGSVARSLAFAYSETFRLKDITIWGRTSAKAEKLAESLCDGGIPARATRELCQGVRTADIVSVATLSKEPLVLAKDVTPGTHVDLVGGFTREMREADDALMAAAKIVADFPSTCDEAGDLALPFASGVIGRENICFLREILDGSRQGRTSVADITVFKSAGHASEDLAAAELLLGRWSR